MPDGNFSDLLYIYWVRCLARFGIWAIVKGIIKAAELDDGLLESLAAPTSTADWFRPIFLALAFFAGLVIAKVIDEVSRLLGPFHSAKARYINSKL